MVKREAAVGLAVLAVIISAVIGFKTVSQGNPIGGLVEGMHSSNIACVYVDRLGQGQNILAGCTSNNITTAALNMSNDKRLNRAVGNMSWGHLMLSNDTTSPNRSMTWCPSNYTLLGMNNTGATINGTMAEVAGTANNGESANYSVTFKWTAIGTTSALTKVCLLNGSWNSAGTNLMGSALFSSSVTLNNEENLTVVYYVGEA